MFVIVWIANYFSLRSAKLFLGMSYQNFFIYSKLCLKNFELSNSFSSLILLLARSNACWNDNKAFMVVVFEQSLKLSFKSSWESFGLRQKQESGWIGKFNEVIKSLPASFALAYVLFDWVKDYGWPFFRLICCHRSEIVISEVVIIQLYFWSEEKLIFRQNSLYSAWMLQRIPVKDGFTYLKFLVLKFF